MKELKNLFIVIMFLVITFIFTQKIELNIFYTVILDILLVIGLGFIYRESIKEHWKDLKIRNNYMHILEWWSILSIINYLSLKIINNISNNQIQIDNLKSSYYFIVLISSTLFAPLIEEIIFRLSFKNIFKNKIFYIIFSSLVFAFIHVIPFNEYDSLLNIIQYSLIGVILSYLYLKNNNIFISILVHSLFNFMGMIMPLLI